MSGTSPSVSLTPAAKAVVVRLAETLDVADAIVASALIQHAARSDVTRIVATWLADNPRPATARPTARMTWTVEPGETKPGSLRASPATYRLGEWVLFRLGDPDRRESGSGWYLEGPDIAQPRFLDRKRPAAQREAEAIIKTYQGST